MCLVVVAWGMTDDVGLLVAGNRDEQHARPTQDAHWWPEPAGIAGGRDLQSGGTWLGTHHNGRFAAVTNYRGVAPAGPGQRSRGHLVTEFLQSDLAPLEFLQTIAGDTFAGFNLLVAHAGELGYMSNQGDAPRLLPRGIYGLANTSLDASGERISRSKARLRELLASGRADDDALMKLLGNREAESEDPFDAPFVVTPEFGTRSSTVVRFGRSGRWSLRERRFDAAGRETGESLIVEDG